MPSAHQPQQIVSVDYKTFLKSDTKIKMIFRQDALERFRLKRAALCRHAASRKQNNDLQTSQLLQLRLQVQVVQATAVL